MDTKQLEDEVLNAGKAEQAASIHNLCRALEHVAAECGDTKAAAVARFQVAMTHVKYPSLAASAIETNDRVSEAGPGDAQRMALAIRNYEMEAARHNDATTQWTITASALTGHLSDMYRRFGIPESHHALLDPICATRPGEIFEVSE